MPNSTNQKNPPRITKEVYEKEVLTRGKFEAIFNEIKDLIKSTAKGTESCLGRRIEDSETRLRTEMQGMEKRLSDRIGNVEKNLSETEKRLSDKIDGIGKRTDNHEARITTLENTRPQH